jgi:hypothetical protein
MEDVKKLKLELGETKMEVLNHLNEKVTKREQAQEHLQVLMTQNSKKLLQNPCCFAGADDEFVVGASNDDGIYMWHIVACSGQRRHGKSRTFTSFVAWSSRHRS